MVRGERLLKRLALARHQIDAKLVCIRKQVAPGMTVTFGVAGIEQLVAQIFQLRNTRVKLRGFHELKLPITRPHQRISRGRTPAGEVTHVDPEEAFVASLSGCHMLTFLAIACKQQFVIDSYEDEAVGHLEKNADGKLAITRVELRPKITWGGDRKPSADELDKMHHAAHENCFVANSVRTVVTVTNL